MNIVSVNWLELLGIWLFGGVMDFIVTTAIFYISNTRYYGREMVHTYIIEFIEELSDIRKGWQENGPIIVAMMNELVVLLLILLPWPYTVPKIFISRDKELQEISEQL